MIKILFVVNFLIIITALLFSARGVKFFKNDECSKRGIECILWGSSISGICIIIGAILLVPTFYPI